MALIAFVNGDQQPDNVRRGRERKRLHDPVLRAAERASSGFKWGALGRLVTLEVLNAYHVYEGPALALGTAGIQQLTEMERTRLEALVAQLRSAAEASAARDR